MATEPGKLCCTSLPIEVGLFNLKIQFLPGFEHWPLEPLLLTRRGGGSSYIKFILVRYQKQNSGVLSANQTHYSTELVPQDQLDNGTMVGALLPLMKIINSEKKIKNRRFFHNFFPQKKEVFFFFLLCD